MLLISCCAWFKLVLILPSVWWMGIDFDELELWTWWDLFCSHSSLHFSSPVMCINHFMDVWCMQLIIQWLWWNFSLPLSLPVTFIFIRLVLQNYMFDVYRIRKDLDELEVIRFISVIAALYIFSPVLCINQFYGCLVYASYIQWLWWNLSLIYFYLSSSTNYMCC